MSSYDYGKKIIEFSQEINRFISLKDKSQDTERLLALIHKILFYAEQYFIEQELEARSNPERLEQIKQERQEVIARLKSFAESIERFEAELQQMQKFLEKWRGKLSVRQTML